MTIYRNGGEGGTDGVTVTTGNSGGASGTAWDAVNLNGGDIEFDTAQSAHDSVSYLIQPASGAITELRKNFTGDPMAMISFYVRISSTPTVTSTIAQIRNATSAALHVQVTAPDTTVAAGSNGVNTSTFVGTQSLSAASTTAFAPSGTLTVATGGTPATITYTSKNSTTFQNCTTTSGGGVLSTGGAISQNRAFRMNNAAGTITHTTAPISLNTWYRVEARVEQGADTATGTIEFAYYLLDNTTPVETAYSSSTQNSGTTEYTNVRYGRTSSATTDVSTYWIDSITTLSGADAAALEVVWPAALPDGGGPLVCTSTSPVTWE